jgi:cell wall-associated NlpC family hydrolase
MMNIALPRDASQQIEHGTLVPFPEQGEAGDLAFFENEKGNISHVGILLNSQEIIHASGTVRIDRLDSEGIFKESENRYTHKLRLIKRVLS